MREDTAFRIRAFRQALEEAPREMPEERREGSRWNELKNFPAGSCDLASNCLAQYLKDCGEYGEPGILFMCGNETFRVAENSTVHAHVIVTLNGEYIDLTLDQFDEYTGYIPAEPVETGGVVGKLLKKIPHYEGEITTRPINCDGLGEIYIWLKDRADALLAADPDWQAQEQSVAEFREEVMKMFPFLSPAPKTGTDVPGEGK